MKVKLNVSKKAKTSNSRGTKKVGVVLTLSKYNFGMHHFCEDQNGEPSFAESLSPLHYMIEDLYKKHKVPLGTKIEVTMRAIGPKVAAAKKR